MIGFSYLSQRAKTGKKLPMNNFFINAVFLISQISTWIDCLYVVYFHQRMHGQKWLKTRFNELKRLKYTTSLNFFSSQNNDSQWLVYLHAPYMSLSYAWWKRYFFHHFQMFSIDFNHANACTSMCLLVEIHNT